jgi:plastocyanin
MSIRNAIALLTIGALPFAAACSGGEPQAPAAAPAEAPKPEAAAPAAAGGTGSLTGKVSFEGTVPPAERVKVSADPKCLAMHKDGLEKQPILVKDGGLANVVVYVKSPVSGSFPAPTQPVELNQTGCNYDPHVVALQVGQPLEIVNNDDTLHNIHPRPTLNQEFNLGQPRKGMKSQRTFDKPEVLIPVGCDVHPWMRAYIAVLANPFFAVTKDDGTFEIKGLPPGDYEIEAIHEKLKNQTQKVTVKAGDATKLDFTFKG